MSAMNQMRESSQVKTLSQLEKIDDVVHPTHKLSTPQEGDQDTKQKLLFKSTDGE